MRDIAKLLIERLGLIGTARRVRRLLPGWRRRQAGLRTAHAAFLDGAEARLQAEIGDLPVSRRALVVGFDNPQMAGLQLPLILALRLAGFHTTVLLPFAHDASADFYRAIGANAIAETETLAPPLNRAAVRRLCAAATDPESVLALEYRGVAIGRFVASTAMRRYRVGNVDPRAPGMREAVAERIAASVAATDIAHAAIAETAPELVCFYDRGYTPDGELFEAALATGARPTTLNAAHKSGFLISKRYGPANKDRHFGAPSAATWAALQRMDWTDAHWRALRAEVEGAYRAGTWFDEVGTQVDKRVLTGPELIRDLGLDPARKTGVVFPHMFWDATFFWGVDLFDDYRDWFCRVLEAAAANEGMNWIVKIHPANLVKNARDGIAGEASEVVAAREVLGKLPDHIKLLPPDSPVSTLSLYDVMDVCLTVRGTVGLEAAMFGIPVLTAGTGRYDGFGFTIDSRSREEYLARLADIHTIAPPDARATETARRYCYGMFVTRPLETTTLRFRYAQDAAASLELSLDLPDDRALADCPDIARLADWLASDDEDLHGMEIETAPAAPAVAPEPPRAAAAAPERQALT